MAVFNAAANQVLPQPVTSYYQGKAIRQGLEEKEEDIKLKRFANETAEERFEMDKEASGRDERRVQVDEARIKLAQDQFEALVGEATAKEVAFDLYHRISNVNTRVQSGELNGQGGLEFAAAQLMEYADSLPEAAAKQAEEIRAKAGDGLTEEEWRWISEGSQIAYARYWPTQANDDYKAKHEYLGRPEYGEDPNRKYLMIIKKDGTRDMTGIAVDAIEESGLDLSYKPGKNEIEIANSYIEDLDDDFEQLEPKGAREFAAYLMATTYTQIMSESPDQNPHFAWGLAAERIKHLIQADPSFFDSNRTSFNLSPELSDGSLPKGHFIEEDENGDTWIIDIANGRKRLVRSLND